MHETENALLYAPPPPDDEVRLGVRLDEAALRALEDHEGPWPLVVAAELVDDEADVLDAYGVLEVARAWYGPVVVRARDALHLSLQVGGRLHVPARLRGGVEQQ